MISKKAIAICAIVGVSVSGIVMAAPANAEPVSNSYAIVGSDTLQDVVNAAVNGTTVSGSNVRSLANGTAVGSFDATGGVLIQTKPAGARFGRPNGSGDGVKALSRSLDGAAYTSATPGSPAAIITGQVDIARSSSGPGSSANTNGLLAYVPFGRDALTYAHSGTNTGFDNLDLATLTGIFNCSITAVNGVSVTAVIPQAGSGTRESWLSKLSLTSAYSTANPSCVKVGQEHDTIALADGSPFPDNAITAMSAAQWVAQNTGAGINRIGTATNRVGMLNPAKVGTPIAGTNAVTGAGAAMTPNSAFYSNATWGRDTYLVVEYARIEAGNPKFDATLANLLDPSKASSLTNTGTFASTTGAAKKKFGFLAPSSTTPLRSNLR
ncbi:hypothetical protein E3T28_12045 [Cryobacterium sinapicolor]|uniref:PBP domain-containing protein n=1 Tax=Cryobacterium sinapicolor TaxID=1259236 RepID=A0ABY2J041_9MICO|nr:MULTISPECIES: hypothetical protein [Cryobacterium]TFC85125.1 hypothetical protein E3O67_12125 [Cryobacterium sp. TMT3-29-2]TFC96569.1 hypothetical protein E3T28_12045 [Cryobacterium sinapicolor]